MRRSHRHIVLAASVAVALAACDRSSPTSSGDGVDPRVLSGGDLTVMDASSQAFEFPAPTMSADQLTRFMDGDARFEETFVNPPAPIRQGLGPLFNQTSCVSCHRKDGRGTPEFSASNPASGAMLMRVSLAGSNPNVPNAPNPVPGYGTQIGDRANYGKEAEARVTVTYTTVQRQFADGETYELRIPSYTLTDAYTELPVGVLMSPRNAPPSFGLGLLEAVAEETILGFAQSGADRNVSGRPNYVWNAESQSLTLGRFGHKANTPTLRQQAAGAYNQDMGLTSTVFPIESAHGQIQHDGRDDDPEISDEVLDEITFYLQTLAVPARRDVGDPGVLHGEKLFGQAGCTGCHIPAMLTGSHEVALLSNQMIHPYTDLLLHDLGDELADGRPDFDANGNEWRTAPLWGIGLTRTVTGKESYLHDGRARTIMEAVMFHGGEAEDAREAVREMSSEERTALLAFLKSL